MGTNHKMQGYFNNKVLDVEEFRQICGMHPMTMITFMLQTAQFNRMYPSKVVLVSAETVRILKKELNPKQSRDSAFDFSKIPYMCGHNYNAMRSFSVDNHAAKQFFRETLTEYDGFVAAGSYALYSAKILGSYSDIDLFPCIGDPKKSYDNWLRKLQTKIEVFNNAAYFKRSRYVTTLVYHKRNGQQYGYNNSMLVHEMQFIHRNFTSPAAVIAGFDQAPCRVFFDGQESYFTIDAALCSVFGINPVDYRFESETMDQRIHKYQNYGYVPIFVGLRKDASFPIPAKVNSLHENIEFYYTEGSIKMSRYIYPNNPNALEHANIVYSDYDQREAEGTQESLYWENPCVVIGRVPAMNVVNAYQNKPEYIVKLISFRTMMLMLEEQNYDIEDKDIEYSGDFQADKTLAERIKDAVDFDDYRTLKKFDKKLKTSLFILDFMLGVFNRDVEERSSRRDYPKPRYHTDLIDVEKFDTHQKIVKSIIEIYLERAQEMIPQVLKELSQPVEFINVNPGRQYTASFNPINQTPEKFWGSNYVPYDYVFGTMEIKLLIFVRPKLPKDVLKIIHRHMYLMELDSVIRSGCPYEPEVDSESENS